MLVGNFFFFFSSRRRHTRFDCDWSSDVCSSDLLSADWYAARYLSLRAKSSYKWLDRFIDGGVSFERFGQLDVPGSSIRLGWQHQQRFSSRTRFSASVDYASNTSVIQTNTVNPFLATASLSSQMSFTKQFDWGTLTVGGNRRQEVGSGLVSQTIPTVDRKSTRLNSSHSQISYAVFCLKKKKHNEAKCDAYLLSVHTTVVGV